MGVLTREQILARKLAGAEPFDLPDGSGQVMLRGLTRNEALAVKDGETTADKDDIVVSLGMVEPALSIEDVAAWAAADDAGTLAAISNRISELSRMQEGAGKSGVQRPRRRR